MDDKRLLLCRPQGGLNDMLCQIEKACSYADAFARTVIVETDYCHSKTFHDAFAHYFVAINPKHILTTQGLALDFDAFSVVPHELFGRVSRYSAHYDHDSGNHVDDQSEVLTSFDMDRDHSENLLIHHACGWVPGLSVKALSRFQLRDEIIQELSRRLALLGPGYTAFHIRDTDYRTNYQQKILQVAKKVRGALFVATDNYESVEFCRSVFGNDRVFSFSDLPNEAGLPLHYFQGDINVYSRNRDALVDLLMLALSRKYFFFPLAYSARTGNSAPRYSGFSMLAQELRQQPRILRKLIGNRENIALPSMRSRYVGKAQDFYRMLHDKVFY